MDRTTPSRRSDELALYIRTYYSLLRSTEEVQIQSLVEAHTRINSALHVKAKESTPDMAAFIYVVLRMPACLSEARLIVMGQSEQVFANNGYPGVEKWEAVNAVGRRRYYFFDGDETIAVYIASRSDIDDMIPSLTAYQIERRKLNKILSKPAIIKLLSDSMNEWLPDAALEELSGLSQIPAEDLDRLQTIWGTEFSAYLLRIAQEKQSLSVKLLAGSLADYRRATRSWWTHVCQVVPEIHFEDHPIYFVSSNTHSLANLLSGFALAQESDLVSFIESRGPSDLKDEYYDILERNVPSSRANFLYYALKKFEAVHPQIATDRIRHEESLGIKRAPSHHVFDVEVQVIEMSKLRPENLDPRLRLPGVESLRKSKALIINIDFPLGMAAYLVLSEVARNIADIHGVFIMGKAATLNGRIGDIMIPNVVHDEQSENTYLFDNCFKAIDVAPHLVYGTVMDNQKVTSALGTFLQNESFMDIFYQEGYTIIEMEAGPFLSSIYEMTRPQRFPRNELVNLYGAPFPIGVLHYASDTPFSKGKNLGSQNLSYFGMDPTYATMRAILHKILSEEMHHNSDSYS
jgi:hypothetical protein